MLSLHEDILYLKDDIFVNDVLHKLGFFFPCHIDNFLMTYGHYLCSTALILGKESISGFFKEFLKVIESDHHLESVYTMTFMVMSNCAQESLNLNKFLEKIPNSQILVETIRIIFHFNLNFCNFLLNNFNQNINFLFEFLIVSATDKVLASGIFKILLNDAFADFANQYKSTKNLKPTGKLSSLLTMMSNLINCYNFTCLKILLDFLMAGSITSDYFVFVYLMAEYGVTINKDVMDYFIGNLSLSQLENLVHKFTFLTDADFYGIFLGLFSSADFSAFMSFLRGFSGSTFLVDSANKFIKFASNSMENFFPAETELSPLVRKMIDYFDDNFLDFKDILTFALSEQRFEDQLLHFIVVFGLNLNSIQCARILAHVIDAGSESYRRFFITLTETWIFVHNSVLVDFFSLIQHPPCKSLKLGTFYGKIEKLLEGSCKSSYFTINMTSAINSSLPSLLDFAVSSLYSPNNCKGMMLLFSKVDLTLPDSLVSQTKLAAFVVKMFVRLLEFHRFNENFMIVKNLTTKFANSAEFCFIIIRELICHVIEGDATELFQEKTREYSENIETLIELMPEAYKIYFNYHFEIDRTPKTVLKRRYLVLWLMSQTISDLCPFKNISPPKSLRNLLGSHLVSTISNKLGFVIHESNSKSLGFAWDLFQKNTALWDIALFLCAHKDVSPELCRLVLCMLVHLKGGFGNTVSALGKSKVVKDLLNPVLFMLKRIERIDLAEPMKELLESVDSGDAELVVSALWEFSDNEKYAEFHENKTFSDEFRLLLLEVFSRNITTLAPIVGCFL